jgi:predicted nucleotidyltransferase
VTVHYWTYKPLLLDAYSHYNGHMTPLDILARELGVSGRTLRRAVNEGTLRARRPSPRILEMPVGERVYARHHWALLAKLRAALRTERNVRFAMLFGSTARGEDSETSDVDVIVSLRDLDYMHKLDLRMKLEDAIGRSVDAVLLEEAEEDPTFLAMALEDGRVLVDREEVWPGLRRREASLRRRGRRQDLARRRRALAAADRFLAARR